MQNLPENRMQTKEASSLNGNFYWRWKLKGKQGKWLEKGF